MARAVCSSVPLSGGLEVEHVDGVEMRVAVAKVLTVAANAVLVAQHLLKLGTSFPSHFRPKSLPCPQVIQLSTELNTARFLWQQ